MQLVPHPSVCLLQHEQPGKSLARFGSGRAMVFAKTVECSRIALFAANEHGGVLPRNKFDAKRPATHRFTQELR